MKKLTLLLCFFSFILSSCSDNKGPDIPPETTEAEHTLFIFMPWVEDTGLTNAFAANIVHIQNAIKNDILGEDNKVVIFFMSSSSKATMFELKYSDGSSLREVHKSYDNPKLTKAKDLTSLLEDVKECAKAKKYSMAIASHGLGWLPVGSPLAGSSGQSYYWESDSSLRTRFFGGTTAKTQIEVSDLAKAITDAGIKMEYILFDACYMSSIEVAYDLRNAAEYLIGCPTEVMESGFPYATITEHLFGDIDLAGVCNGFIDFYENSLSPYGTVGVIVCSEMDKMASVMKEINAKHTLEESKLGSIQRMCGHRPVVFFDFGDYVAKLCEGDKGLLDKFSAQLELTVPSKYAKHTGSFFSMLMTQPVEIEAYSGVSISDPSINSVAVTAKTETAWYKATH